MGATAIRSLTGFPGLRLTGVITSAAEKAGRDAAAAVKAAKLTLKKIPD